MSIEQQIADARVAAGNNKLFAAKIASAYAATWRYRYVKAIAPELIETLVAQIEDFDVNITGLDFVAEATDVSNEFINSVPFPIIAGNGVRVRVTAEFVPSPITSAGNMTVLLHGNVSGDIVSQSLNADGTIDFTYIASQTESLTLTISGGQSSQAATDWDIGQIANVSVSATAFPPGFGITSFPLNPAIPFHRVVLAIPDNTFNCIVRATFENGGSIQGTPIEVAVGKVPNLTVINPPTKNLQCRLITADDTGSGDSMLLNNQTITDEAGLLISPNVAVFEWTAVADKVNFEIINASIDAQIGVGIMQMPPS